MYHSWIGKKGEKWTKIQLNHRVDNLYRPNLKYSVKENKNITTKATDKGESDMITDLTVHISREQMEQWLEKAEQKLIAASIAMHSRPA